MHNIRWLEYLIILFSTSCMARSQQSFTYSYEKNELGSSKRQYELINHLSSVLTLVSDDRKLNSDEGSSMVNIKSASDYYPGGMLQNGRHYYENHKSIFKHQGQESDDEIAGVGTNYLYKYRMSDSRLNRFWSLDPASSSIFDKSAYSFGGNRLIDRIEYAGLSEDEANTKHFSNRLYDNGKLYRATTDARVMAQWVDLTASNIPAISAYYEWGKIGAETVLGEYGGLKKKVTKKLAEESAITIIDSYTKENRKVIDVTGWSKPKTIKVESKIGKGLKKIVGATFGILDVKDSFNDFLNITIEPTREEYLEAKTFDLMEEWGLGHEDIAGHGTFKAKDHVSNKNLVNYANKIYENLSNYSKGFELSGKEGKAMFEKHYLNSEGKSQLFDVVKGSDDKTK